MNKVIEKIHIKNKTVCHMSSVHSRCDIRIFYKECKSLSKTGYDVHLIVADGNGDEIVDDITIHDVGKSKNRFDRMWRITRRVLRKAREVSADVYHFHDPELIPVGLRLKRDSKHVIYDVHEDLPRDIITKNWIHPLLRKLVSSTIEVFENFAARRFSAVVTATPFIAGRFRAIGAKGLAVNNFPILTDFFSDVEWQNKKNEICYVGGISKIRGIVEVIASLCLVDTRLNLAGKITPNALRDLLKSQEGWEKVNELGVIDRAQVREVLERSKIGLVTFHPLPNHIDAQPNKMFEYMSAGIPVIASHFNRWKEIVEGHKCGLCVDPESPEEIAQAISYLLNNPEEAQKMGLNGRKAVEEIYNWSIEEGKLLSLYEDML